MNIITPYLPCREYEKRIHSVYTVYIYIFYAYICTQNSSYSSLARVFKLKLFQLCTNCIHSTVHISSLARNDNVYEFQGRTHVHGYTLHTLKSCFLFLFLLYFDPGIQLCFPALGLVSCEHAISHQVIKHIPEPGR